MDDPFDTIPVPYRTERLGRARDLVMQIEADYAYQRDIMQRLEAGNANQSDIEELQKSLAWLKRDMMEYSEMNSISIEGVTCGEIGLIKAQLY